MWFVLSCLNLVFGTRRRGRQRTRITDEVKSLAGLRVADAIAAARDRNRWRTVVHRATDVSHLSMILPHHDDDDSLNRLFISYHKLLIISFTFSNGQFSYVYLYMYVHCTVYLHCIRLHASLIVGLFFSYFNLFP